MEIKYCFNCEKIFIEEKKCPSCSQNLTLLDENFLIGQELGKYKIESFIGEGGMGAVFKGIHTTLKKPVAIKILTPSKLEPTFLKRFKKEAEVMALLKHPNIVEIYDYDISSFGFPYIVMEYLEGLSLRVEIQKYQNGLPLNLFKSYIKQIVSGLILAHKKGIVHRDLKPENLFICNIGDQKILKILDFGIAKVLFSTDETQIVTKTDTIVGTPHYLSPEQIMCKEITPKSDQYALALIAFEMLTGRPAREGKTFGEIVSSISTRNVEFDKFDFKELKIEIAEALKKATNKNPDERFEDVEAFEKNLIPEVDEVEDKPTTAITFKKQKTKKFKHYFLLFFLLFLIPIYFFFSGKNKTEKNEIFSFGESYPVPSDLGSYLTSKENLLCFEGLKNLYLYLNDFSKEPIKISLKEDENVLGGTKSGKIIILKNRNVYLKEYILDKKIDEREELLINDFVDFKEEEFSSDLNYVAIKNENELLVYEIIEKNLKEKYKIDLKNGRLKSFKMGKNYFAYVINDSLTVYDLRKNEKLLNVPIDTSNFYSMDFFEEMDLFAIGGWFNFVYIFDLKEGLKKYSLNMPSATNSLKFINDYPTLLISKGNKVLLWRFREDKIFKFQEDGKEFSFSDLTPLGILSIERRENKIYIFSYKDFYFYKKYTPSKTQIWGMDYSKEMDLLFAGSSSGILYSIDLKKDKIKNFQIHTQGITYVLSLKDNIITASDDKTIAVWEVPEMKVAYRTEAHNWLINFLYFNESTNNLWSSSSDGFIKILSFPGLKVIDSIKTGEYSNAAIWVNSKEEKLAVGTWNYQFLFLEKRNSKWEVLKNYKIKSLAIYSMAYLSNLGAIVLCGVEPYNLYIYFIGEKKLYDLGFENSGINWIVPCNENSIYAAGNSGIYSISFDKEKMEIKTSLLTNTDFKINLVSVYIKGKNIFALGNEVGEIVLIDLNKFKFPDGYYQKIEKEILP